METNNTSSAGYFVTSKACCQLTSNVFESTPMTKPIRRKLSEDELADASKLRAILQEKKATTGITQETVGHLCGWAGQQAVQAYLSGNTPINLDAAFRFSKALGVTLDEISPRLAAKAVELFGATLAGGDSPLVARYQSADAATRALIDMALAQPQDPVPDGLSPSVRAMVEMARAALREELKKKNDDSNPR